MTQPVYRLAPSPNGRLHLGHAYSFLLNEAMARENGGRLLLRIEDTDLSRCDDSLARLMLEDIRWLGISFEEPVRVQSEHLDEYRRTLENLWQRSLVFPCFCSRKTAASEVRRGHDPVGTPLYGGRCRTLPRQEAMTRLQQGHSHGWRLVTDGTGAAAWGDVLIAKPVTGSWYNIAVVVDDAVQGVTHVVRGMDLEPATDIHRVLQHYLGFVSPHYHHHRLLLDDTGRKLSKRFNSPSLDSLRQQGVTPQVLRRELGFS